MHVHSSLCKYKYVQEKAVLHAYLHANTICMHLSLERAIELQRGGGGGVVKGATHRNTTHPNTLQQDAEEAEARADVRARARAMRQRGKYKL